MMESNRSEVGRVAAEAGASAGREAHGHVEALFVELLRRDGLHAALGFLNGRVRYRFTGVYRFAPPVLRNVDLFDRENPSLTFSGCELVLRDSYCGIVQMTERPFVTNDATRDERLRGYAARVSMVSYLGVPLRLRGGGLFGTLCHWDGRPRLAPDGEVDLLERLAPRLASSLAALARVD